MTVPFTPARSAAIGTVVLMACACGAGASSAKLVSMTGMNVTAKLTHSFLLSIGALLVVYGLWRITRAAGYLAIGGFAVLAAAAALTPPTVMSATHLPWHGAQIAGGVLYFVFAFALVYAFWLAFPSPRPGAFATALGGTAVATGCSCCMVTGAVAGLAVTAGGDPAVFLTLPIVFFTGIAITAVSLSRLSGLRPVQWLIAGALLTRYGGRGLQLVGDWMVGDVNMRFIPGYLIYLIGAGLVVKAWAVAYEPIRARGSEPVAEAVPEPAF